MISNCIVNTMEPPAYIMVFDLSSVFHEIILNVKHGLLFTPTHCAKQTKHCTLTVSS